MAEFRGWPAEAIEFFEGLEADNSKSYWEQHKPVYDKAVRAPMEALLTDLEPTYGPGRIFRPYRDIRFSRDKSPYKTSIAATVGEGYVQLSTEGLGVGTGMWEMAPDQLERYRAAVDAARTGRELDRIVATARAAGLDAMGHGILKSAPKGYPKDHPRIELLRYKGLIAWKQWPPGAWLGTPKAKDRIVDVLDKSKALTRWLTKNVGESTMPDPMR